VKSTQGHEQWLIIGASSLRPRYSSGMTSTCNGLLCQASSSSHFSPASGRCRPDFILMRCCVRASVILRCGHSRVWVSDGGRPLWVAEPHSSSPGIMGGSTFAVGCCRNYAQPACSRRVLPTPGSAPASRAGGGRRVWWGGDYFAENSPQGKRVFFYQLPSRPRHAGLVRRVDRRHRYPDQSGRGCVFQAGMSHPFLIPSFSSAFPCGFACSFPKARYS